MRVGEQSGLAAQACAKRTARGVPVEVGRLVIRAVVTREVTPAYWNDVTLAARRETATPASARFLMLFAGRFWLDIASTPIAPDGPFTEKS